MLIIINIDVRTYNILFLEVKRERGKNYSEIEKENLIEIASEFKHIIENKKTDNVSVKQKEDAWETIAAKWNSISLSGPRKKDQLKMLYSTMKKQAKKRAAEDKVCVLTLIINYSVLKSKICIFFE